MNKIQKLMTTLSAGAALVSIVPTMSSCATNQEHNHAVEDETDIQYGLNENTYRDMKEDFKKAYIIKLQDSGITDPAEIAKRLDQLSTQLKVLDNANSQGNTISYTTLTTALRSFAGRVYGISLARISKASWDDIRIMKDGCLEQIEIYMDHAKIKPEIREKVRAETAERFATIEADLDKGGYRNDPLGALQIARLRIVECFDSVSAEIAQVAGVSKLEQFLKRYTFEYKEFTSEGGMYTENRIDTLLEKYPDEFAVGKDISKFMNTIFDITDVEQGTEHVPFDPPHMVPNYDIRPILGNITKNPYNNSYTLDIDWTAIKSEVLAHPTNDFNAENCTAHLYTMGEDVELEDDEALEKKTLGEILAEAPSRLTSYTAAYSPLEEQNIIKETYFNPKSPEGCIAFKWDDPENCKYERFFDGIGTGKTTGIVGFDSLTKAGLLISEDNGKTYKTFSDFVNSFNEKEQFNATIKEDAPQKLRKLTLGEQFVNYMNVTSEVSLDPTDKEHHVSNIFTVQYNKSLNHRDSDSTYVLGHYDCQGFPISEEFFLRSSCAYNKASLFYKQYFDHNFSKLKLEGGGVIAGECIGEAGHLALLGKFIVTICKPTSFPTQKTWAAVGIVSTTAALAVGGARLGLYIDKHFKKIGKWQDKSQELKKSGVGESIKSKIESDKEIYVNIDDDGNYNQDEYDKKYDEFKSGDFEVYRQKFAYYQTFQQQPEVKEFMAIAKDKGIDPDSYSPTFSKFDFGGSQFPTYIGLVAAEAIIGIVQGKAAFHITKKQADKDEALRQQKMVQRYHKKDRETSKRIYKEVMDIDPKVSFDEAGNMIGATGRDFPLANDPEKAYKMGEDLWQHFFRDFIDVQRELDPNYMLPVKDPDKPVIAWLMAIFMGSW